MEHCLQYLEFRLQRKRQRGEEYGATERKCHFCQMLLRDQESIRLNDMGILGDLDKSSFNTVMKMQVQIKLG